MARHDASVLQLLDSSFPTGGYAYSSGIEILVRDQEVRDRDSLERLLASHRRLTVDRCDAWFARRAHRACDQRTGSELAELARREHAARPASVQRRAAIELGTRLLDQAAAVFDTPGEAEALAWVQAELGTLRPVAVSMGATVWALEGTEEEAAAAVTYAALAGLVAAAVRLGVIGAYGALGILGRVLSTEVGGCGDEPSSFSPVMDLASMRREQLEQPLFLS
jgi:urease accessory protein